MSATSQLLLAASAAPLGQLARSLLSAGAPAENSDQVAALRSMAELLDCWAALANAGDDDARFDDLTAELALQQLATVRVLDATRPGERFAGQLLDAAVELRRVADQAAAKSRPWPAAGPAAGPQRVMP